MFYPLTNFSMNYLVMYKVYTGVSGIEINHGCPHELYIFILVGIFNFYKQAEFAEHEKVLKPRG